MPLDISQLEISIDRDLKPITVPGLDHPVQVWDESKNVISGTHKDRLALWTLQQEKFREQALSIISSGSAALALQRLVRVAGLPNVKALVDPTLDDAIKTRLETIGCEVYESDLHDQVLDSEEILKITNNLSGIDLTNLDLRPAYTDLARGALSKAADHYFVPYGSGSLYTSIARELGRSDQMADLMGATSYTEGTAMKKLYISHRPFVSANEHSTAILRSSGRIGPESGISPVDEGWVKPASKLVLDHGISAEPSAISGLALLLQKQSEGWQPDGEVVVISTGQTRWSDF